MRPDLVSRITRQLSIRPKPSVIFSPPALIFVVILVPPRRSDASLSLRYASPLVFRFVYTRRSCALRCNVCASASPAFFFAISCEMQ